MIKNTDIFLGDTVAQLDLYFRYLDLHYYTDDTSKSFLQKDGTLKNTLPSLDSIEEKINIKQNNGTLKKLIIRIALGWR